MKERPILFSTEMVKAILTGRKTQTRRVVKVQPSRSEFTVLQQLAGTTGDKSIVGKYHWGNGNVINNKSDSKYFNLPYGNIGDRLWVLETWYPQGHDGITDAYAIYKADDPFHREGPWNPSIYMPKWASRITLEITGKRVERLNDISEEDAFAEGIDEDGEAFNISQNIIDNIGGFPGAKHDVPDSSPAKAEFRHLWNSINEKRGYGWETNPMVLVIEFERIKE